MAVLEKEQFDKVVDCGKKALAELKNGHYDEFLALAEHAWALFPPPVENWNQAYNYAKSIFTQTLIHRDFVEAKKWLNRLIDNNNNLHLFDTEVRYQIGKYHFEKGEYDDAFKNWDVLIKEVGYRYFEYDKAEYINFYKNPQKYKSNG